MFANIFKFITILPVYFLLSYFCIPIILFLTHWIWTINIYDIQSLTVDRSNSANQSQLLEDLDLKAFDLDSAHEPATRGPEDGFLEYAMAKRDSEKKSIALEDLHVCYWWVPMNPQGLIWFPHLIPTFTCYHQDSLRGLASAKILDPDIDSYSATKESKKRIIEGSY